MVVRSRHWTGLHSEYDRRGLQLRSGPRLQADAAGYRGVGTRPEHLLAWIPSQRPARATVQSSPPDPGDKDVAAAEGIGDGGGGGGNNTLRLPAALRQSRAPGAAAMLRHLLESCLSPPNRPGCWFSFWMESPCLRRRGAEFDGGADPPVCAGPPGPAPRRQTQLDPAQEADGGVGRGPGGRPTRVQECRSRAGYGISRRNRVHSRPRTRREF
jgi:hypothetical protein